MRILILSLIYLPHSAIQAATADTFSISSSDNHRYLYSNLSSRNNFTFPIHVRNLTEHYGDTLTEAGNRINAAFGHTAILDAPSVNPPYLNTIFLFEMNLASTPWLGVSLSYFVESTGSPTACDVGTSWDYIDQNNDLIGLRIGTSSYAPCAGSVAAGSAQSS
jgi:hypothetical protein